MNANSKSSTSPPRLLPLRLLPMLALVASACLTPPPPPAQGAAAPAAAASPAAAGAAAAATGSGREVIWDGDEVTRGQGWASCDKEAEGCKSQLTPAPGEGANGSAGLKLHGEGAGWQGGGWNWFGWWPETAGTDLSGYEELAFSVKVTAAKDKAPTPGGINLAFGCSHEKKNSADASLGNYAANVTDGAWHEVRIPLQDFFGGKGAECDRRTAWELRVSSWSATPVHFDLVLDNISVEKRVTQN